jgi:hypothetical protein
MGFDPYGSLDPANGPVSIRWPIFTRFCLYSIFAIIGGFLIFFSFTDQRLFLRFVSFITGIGTLLLISLSFPDLLRVRWRGFPGLELRPEGFIDHRLSSSLIRWSEIARCLVVTEGLYNNTVKLLTIQLRPGVMDRLEISRWRRWQLRSTFYISANTFECSFDELIKVFRQYAPGAFA